METSYIFNENEYLNIDNSIELDKSYIESFILSDHLTEEEENWDTSEIKCPICGYEESDSWEYDSDQGEIKCGGCGATLEWSREVEVSYSTEVKKSVQPIKF